MRNPYGVSKNYILFLPTKAIFLGPDQCEVIATISHESALDDGKGRWVITGNVHGVPIGMMLEWMKAYHIVKYKTDGDPSGVIHVFRALEDADAAIISIKHDTHSGEVEVLFTAGSKEWWQHFRKLDMVPVFK